MILGPVSYLDCIVFCIFLAPQLILGVGLFETVKVVIQVLPFLVLQLPAGFIYERFFLRAEEQPAFVRQASPFEDVVVRCVRYAFANIPPDVGRVFFGKNVALPWMRWRMLRHGYLRSSVHWREYEDKTFKGVWAVADPTQKPDLVLFYAHGGGFSMGSPYFYLEFLLSWLSTMQSAGYTNPAVFGLDYTLVPDAAFPTQLRQMLAGYEHALGMAGSAARVCVAGDSAGGTLVLSLLLHLAHPKHVEDGGLRGVSRRLEKPGMAVLISPWPALHSPLYRDNRSDFLNAATLREYASLYAGGDADVVADSLASPGDCREMRWWRDACPSGGVCITYGREEVLAPEIERLVQVLQKSGGARVSVLGEDGGVHAWPVVSLFLADAAEERLKGLRAIVSEMKSCIPAGK